MPFDHRSHSSPPLGSALHGLTNAKGRLSAFRFPTWGGDGGGRGSEEADAGPHTFRVHQVTGPAALLGCLLNGLYSVDLFIAGQGPFTLQLDTGSSTLAVASTLCPVSADCPLSLGRLFNVSQALLSRQLVSSGGSAQVNYAGGTGYSGALVTGNVSVDMGVSSPYNGTNHGPDTLTEFVAIANSNHFFYPGDNCPWDTEALIDFAVGIVGFGFTGLNTGAGDQDFIAQYFTQHPTLSPEFTFQLCPVDDGQLWLGYYDPRVHHHRRRLPVHGNHRPVLLVVPVVWDDVHLLLFSSRWWCESQQHYGHCH